MILNGSQRSGAANLSTHLMNDRDNDHVSLYELRGFMGRNLHEALQEAHAISKGTKCEQYMFSLSLNPPKHADVPEQDFVDAIERAEQKLGLDNQPRAIVFHEKEGRRHAHVVWSRIDAQSMKAINLPHFKNKLTSLSRELYLDHGWQMPDGLRHDGGKSPLNFTLAEWQQAKRLKLDPREIKQSFIEAWQRSDTKAAFQHALEERGYFLARGDRRGFVALDINGEVFSVPRMIGIKTKEIRAKLSDPKNLPSVDDTRRSIATKVTNKIHDYIDQVDRKHEDDFAPLKQQRTIMVANHRIERAKLRRGQHQRWQQETKSRNAKLTKGLRGIWDRVSGRRSQIKTKNEREAWQALKRDQKQRDDLVKAQMVERRQLQRNIELLRKTHAKNRQLLARDVAQTLRMSEQVERIQTQERTRVRTRDIGLRL